MALLGDRGAYRALSGEDLAAKVLEFFRRDYYNVKREHVANVLMHMKSLCLVGSHTDAPHGFHLRPMTGRRWNVSPRKAAWYTCSLRGSTDLPETIDTAILHHCRL